MIIPVKTSRGGYDIILSRGALHSVKEYLPLERKVLIVTDSGVPKEYASKVADASLEPFVVTIPEGESSKGIESYQLILEALVKNAFTRTDCIVAVGGGVVGDLSGFAASTYMRGIDFYNIPTTLLSQVDSSIGGKTAIDFMGIKNIVGAFYPPKRVIVDPNTLKTLPSRQISNGLAEAVKMSLTSDKELFSLFEGEGEITEEKLDLIIEKSLLIKRAVVEADEREGGLRRVLNFGHTLAHAIESANEMKNLYHGECVALGMLPMCSDEVRKRLLPVLEKLKLPTEINGSAETLIEACKHDKKLSGKMLTIVYVEEVGSFVFRSIPLSELEKTVKEALL
ncbi:MAG: 3-dehydroquinate synthase [Clostridia bacterium]|nr:3-dehydroquinate synthase [Clostridia bacterium]